MKTFNEVTPAEWRAITPLERSEFYCYWNKRGKASFGCSRCGYPTGECAASCVACEHNPEIRYNAQFTSPQFRRALVALIGARRYSNRFPVIVKSKSNIRVSPQRLTTVSK